MSLWYKFLRWLTFTRLWVYIAKHIVSKFKFRFKGYPTFPMEKYDEILTILAKDKKENRPGVYVFVSRDMKSMSSWLVRKMSRAYWSHAGFILGKNTLEMVGEGMLLRHFLYTLHESDHVAIGRLELKPGGEGEVLNRLRRMAENKGKYKYDFQQFLGGPRYYCSELVYEVCKYYADNPKFVPHVEYGRMMFEPDDLYASMKILFEHRGE